MVKRLMILIILIVLITIKIRLNLLDLIIDLKDLITLKYRKNNYIMVNSVIIAI